MNIKIRLITAVGAAVVAAALLAGCGSSNFGEVHSLQSKVTSLRSRLASSQEQVSKLQVDLSTERQTAHQATARAEAKAKAEYGSKEAKVSALLRKLQREQSVVSKNTISTPGVYVVGRDIAPGTYHTNGDGSQMNCYYATLGSTNTSNILDNNFGGPETVNLNGVYAFQISGDCTWAKMG